LPTLGLIFIACSSTLSTITHAFTPPGQASYFAFVPRRFFRSKVTHHASPSRPHPLPVSTPATCLKLRLC